MTTVPLTPEQIATLRQAEKMLHDLLPDLDNLESCGTDCQKLRQQNSQIRQQITTLQTKFGGPLNGPSIGS